MCYVYVVRICSRTFHVHWFNDCRPGFSCRCLLLMFSVRGILHALDTYDIASNSNLGFLRFWATFLHYKPTSAIIIHQTYYEKSDWSRAFNQFTIALWTWHDKCNICCRYCIYHVKFNFCLVTKPLGVFMAERFASVSEDELCEKCIIKQLLNSVFAWYHELSKPRVCVICLSLRLRQITQTSVLIIHDIMLNLIQ